MTSLTGDATGGWDAGDSGAANNWDAGNSGEAAAWNGGTDAVANGDKPAENSTTGHKDRPPMLCRNCKKEGHTAKECKDNRVLDLSDIQDEQPEIAWQNVVEADKEKDLDDFRKVCRVSPNRSSVDF